MKPYYLLVSFFAVIGIVICFDKHPLIIGIASFGIGISYKFMMPEDTGDDVLD